MMPEFEADVGARLFQESPGTCVQEQEPVLKSLSCVWRKKGNKVSIKLLLRTNGSE